MKESKKESKVTESKFKIFDKKAVFILTKSNFRYNTTFLNVDIDAISFIDNRGNPIFISNDEINFIEAKQ